MFGKIKERKPIANYYSPDTIWCVYHGDSWGFSQWLQKWGGSQQYIAGKCLSEGNFVYLSQSGYWWWENNFCSQPDYSIMTIKDWEKLPIIAGHKIFNKTKEPKMETFKENTYYPIGTKLIYRDKIIEVQKRDPGCACGDCMLNGKGCSDVVCYTMGNVFSTAIKYVVIGDAPEKEFSREVGEKFEYEGKWYEVVKPKNDLCKECAFYVMNCPRKAREVRGSCVDGGHKNFVEIPAPTKHDEPGVEGLEYIDDGVRQMNLKITAKKDNVFITVEPVAKKDVELRIEAALQKWVSQTSIYIADRRPRTILVSEKTWEELKCEFNRRPGWKVTDFPLGLIYRDCYIRRSPDVEDVEIV